jgi:hypothetical protein
MTREQWFKAMNESGHDGPELMAVFDGLELAGLAPWQKAFAYNHTRGDSALTPCPECSLGTKGCVVDHAQDADPMAPCLEDDPPGLDAATERLDARVEKMGLIRPFVDRLAFAIFAEAWRLERGKELWPQLPQEGRDYYRSRADDMIQLGNLSTPPLPASLRRECVEVLREIQVDGCPLCFTRHSEHHTPDCRLAALLSRLEESAPPPAASEAQPPTIKDIMDSFGCDETKARQYLRGYMAEAAIPAPAAPEPEAWGRLDANELQYTYNNSHPRGFSGGGIELTEEDDAELVPQRWLAVARKAGEIAAEKMPHWNALFHETLCERDEAQRELQEARESRDAWEEDRDSWRKRYEEARADLARVTRALQEANTDQAKLLAECERLKIENASYERPPGLDAATERLDGRMRESGLVFRNVGQCKCGTPVRIYRWPDGTEFYASASSVPELAPAPLPPSLRTETLAVLRMNVNRWNECPVCDEEGDDHATDCRLSALIQRLEASEGEAEAAHKNGCGPPDLYREPAPAASASEPEAWGIEEGQRIMEASLIAGGGISALKLARKAGEIAAEKMPHWNALFHETLCERDEARADLARVTRERDQWQEAFNRSCDDTATLKADLAESRDQHSFTENARIMALNEARIKVELRDRAISRLAGERDEARAKMEEAQSDRDQSESELGEAMHELMCPACGCATQADAERKECGCDAPVCDRTANKTLAQHFADAESELIEIREQRDYSQKHWHAEAERLIAQSEDHRAALAASQAECAGFRERVASMERLRDYDIAAARAEGFEAGVSAAADHVAQCAALGVAERIRALRPPTQPGEDLP